MNRHVAPAGRESTHQDVLDAPPLVIAEPIEGALHLHPPPAFRHAHTRSTLGIRVGVLFTLVGFAPRDGGGPLVAALRDAEDVRGAPFDGVAFPPSALWPN